MHIRSILITASLVSAGAACGKDHKTADDGFERDSGMPTSQESVASVADDAEAYNFEGIVSFFGCSGSLVRFDDSEDSDKAIVLTNGHCTGRISPGHAIENRVSTESVALLDRSGKSLGRVRADRILYATMSKTDVALYRLTLSYADIMEQYNIPALTLTREAPKVETAIEVISGYWKRGYRCAIEHITSLQEGDWFYEESLRYSRPGCETIGGTSGSPVLEAGTRQVIAINNTGNESGRVCAENNPCEIDEAGQKTAVKGYSYAQETYWIYSCRNADRTFDFKKSECLLPHPGTAAPSI